MGVVMVKPRRAQPQHSPVFQAVIITELLVAAFVAGVLGAVLIWG